MFAILSTDAAVGGANETLHYTPPGGSTLIGGSLDVSSSPTDVAMRLGTAVAYTPEYAYNSSNVFYHALRGSSVRQWHV